MSSQPSISDLPLHGTCPRCKHFHKNWEFSLPQSGGRVKCERCKTDMFSLGRAGTQYTLASVNSIPLSLLGTNAAAGLAGRSDVPESHSWMSAPPPTDHVTQRFANFPEDDQSIASTKSRLHGVESRSMETQLETHTDNGGVRSATQFVSSIYLRLIRKLPYHETILGAPEYVNTAGTRFAAGLPQVRREYRIFGWRFMIHPPDNDAGEPTPTDLNTNHHIDVAVPENVEATPQMMTGALDPATQDLSSPHPPVAGAENSAEASHPADPENFPAQPAKPSDRLTHHRREKTLAKNALRQVSCGCTRDCHRPASTFEAPSSHSGFDDDTHSNLARTPPHPNDVPTNEVTDRLGAHQFLYFSYMGQSTENSDQSLDTSQASTVGSGGGSVSLRPGRPYLPTRSRSMPGL